MAFQVDDLVVAPILMEHGPGDIKREMKLGFYRGSVSFEEGRYAGSYHYIHLPNDNITSAVHANTSTVQGNSYGRKSEQEIVITNATREIIDTMAALKILNIDNKISPVDLSVISQPDSIDGGTLEIMQESKRHSGGGGGGSLRKRKKSKGRKKKSTRR